MCANNWLEESRRFYRRGAESPSVERRRGAKKVCVTDADKLYICYHHLSKLGRIFEKRLTRFTCCNLFKTHKQNVKGGHKIPLQLATKLLDHRYDCIPGWQLCRTC